MKTLYIVLLAFAAIILTGCDINNPHNDKYFDDYAPAPPRNISLLNGDNRVDIYWDYNREEDVAGYNVYYSYSYDGKYTLIGSTTRNSFADIDAINGDTYYYAVTAYDFNNNESELSKDVIYSTPRPEGFNQAIFDYRRFPDNAGYSFATYAVVPFDDKKADFFFEQFEGTFYFDVYDDSDIQDMGSTNDIYDIDYAPSSGWASKKEAIVIPGHTYVIWTWNNHFAKVRVKSITSERVVFDWAYQLVEGNKQLKPNNKTERGAISRSFQRK